MIYLFPQIKKNPKYLVIFFISIFILQHEIKFFFSINLRVDFISGNNIFFHIKIAFIHIKFQHSD